MTQVVSDFLSLHRMRQDFCRDLQTIIEKSTHFQDLGNVFDGSNETFGSFRRGFKLGGELTADEPLLTSGDLVSGERTSGDLISGDMLPAESGLDRKTGCFVVVILDDGPILQIKTKSSNIYGHVYGNFD